MDKILITGSTGFVGGNLFRYFKDDLEFELSSLDVRNAFVKIKKKNNAIVHLAGKAHDLKKSSNPEEYYNINYELTRILYDAFLQSDCEKFIFISSVKAAADTVAGHLDEYNLPEPQTDYGKSKLMAEAYIQSQKLPDGKSYYILRPCMIHGPGNKGNLNLLYQLVSKGLPYPLASFHNQRSFLSIENLCFVIKGLLEPNCVASGIYHVADDEPLSTNEVVRLLAEAQDRSPKLWHLPKSVVTFIAKAGDSLKLPLNSERLQKLTENYVVSNEKIKKALGVNLPVSSKEGILRTARSFSKRGKGKG